MTAAPLLEAREVRHRFATGEVLRGVSLRIAAGEVVAIIGPNGSGKSTLLRILGRLLRPGGGEVRYAGRDLRSISARDYARRVAFLPQAPEAPPGLTVRELAWRGRYPHRGLFGAARVEDRRAVEQALLLAGIDGLGERALATLSGGERQRAWIALALAQEPALVLLDEPTTFLDIGHQEELLGLLAALNREQGLTVVMVMHDLAQAAHHARRLIALREGTIRFDGPPAEVITVERVRELFGASVRVLRDPDTGGPLIAPAVEEEPRIVGS